MGIFDQVNYTNDAILDAYNTIKGMGGSDWKVRNLKDLPDTIKTIEKTVNGDAAFFGCEDGDEELKYLENIMPEILNLTYGVKRQWD